MKKFTSVVVALLAGVLAFGAWPPAHAAVDVYTTPGEHVSGGREWRTSCEPYSRTARCTTQIRSGGKWVFNNLTYLPSPRAIWAGNPLATPGNHTVAGRRWYTECDTPKTGRNGCRAYIWDGRQFVFNNIVHFGVIWPDLDRLYNYRPPGSTAPAPTPAPPSGYDTLRGPNMSDKVMLTFDDCPNTMDGFKAAVRDAQDLGIALALFPTGNCLTAGRFDPAYARSHGHYVFNHSISHPNLTKVSYAEAVRQLGAPGIVTTYGRPPYGAHNATVRKAYAAVGMRMWLWNYDTLDWHGKTSRELVDEVVANAKPGQTVLMHMQWNGFNETTLRGIRDGLKAKGIGVCRNQGAVAAQPAGVAC